MRSIEALPLEAPHDVMRKRTKAFGLKNSLNSFVSQLLSSLTTLVISRMTYTLLAVLLKRGVVVCSRFPSHNTRSPACPEYLSQ